MREGQRKRESVCVCVRERERNVYICICTYTYIYIYIYYLSPGLISRSTVLFTRFTRERLYSLLGSLVRDCIGLKVHSWEIVYVMGWLWLVGSLKIQASFAEYSLFYRALLHKSPTFLGSLCIEATSYQVHSWEIVFVTSCEGIIPAWCQIWYKVCGARYIILYGVATISKLLKNTSLFGKRDL